MTLMRMLLIALGTIVVSVSVALFYNITFFGQAVLPLPSPLVTGGCLLYYLAGFNQTAPLLQVLLWIASFLVTAGLWLAALHKFLGARQLARLSLASLSLVLPLPWLVWVHAATAEGPRLEALVQAILVRKGLYWNSSGSEPVLNAVFWALASLSLGLELWLLKRDTELDWMPLLVRWGACAIALLLAVSMLAAVPYYLRLFLA